MPSFRSARDSIGGTRRSPNAGFSLVELMVSIAILVFLLALVLANQSKFNSTTLLNDLAYDIALTMRQAQVYGTSVHPSTGAAPFQTGYGAHFDLAAPTQYVLFADINRNHIFDPSTDQVINTYTMRKASITALCSGSTSTCDPAGVLTLDIVYERPQPNAIITKNAGATTYSQGRVTVTSADGTRSRTVFASVTGQTSVESAAQSGS